MPATSDELLLIVEPEALEERLGEAGLRVVDLCKPEVYARAHAPGAVHLDYSRIVAANKPALGLLPDDAALAAALASLGITPDTHVVAYDDEGGGRACRLLWTLEVAGHRHYSLLNGGLHAWANEGHPVDDRPAHPAPSSYRVQRHTGPIADKDYILQHLGDPAVRLLDARSPDEYHGVKRFAAKGGHIPGAINLEWTTAMDPQRNLRLRPEAELRKVLENLGVMPDREVITYCQTHHRSAYSYIMLKSLGYPRVKGYPGSWSEWGNSPDTPVE